MSKIIRNVKKKFARMERGQVLVVVALAAVGIIAIVGLVMDVGLMFIGNARLRRAVDSAALSAALQYRENSATSPTDLINILTRSANEFLVLNGFDNPVSHVYDCYNSPPALSSTLCTTPNPRKLVEVVATADVKLAFLPVIGINSVTISASAVSEAASLDVVLVIDRSESMSYGKNFKLNETDPLRDPFYCNGQPGTGINSGDAGSCQPFDSVINAAAAFTDILIPSYDLAAVVTFDKEPNVVLPLLSGNDPSDVASTLRNLTVFEGEETGSPPSGAAAIFPTGSPSRCYDNRASKDMTTCPICEDDPNWDITNNYSNYKTLLGRGQDPCADVDPTYVNPPDPSHYTTTNIGAGLEEAGIQLATDKRQDVLWVVILLTDGVANAGHNDIDTIYFCPQDTWSLTPRCNHGDPRPAHRISAPLNGPFAFEYDASDYAYDMADFIGKPYPDGQYALLYTIGLGPEVDNYAQPGYVDPYNTDLVKFPTSTNEGLGRIFLNYAANVGRGQAFYATTPSDLDKIFRLIGSNIATRLSQ
jgi:Flp pilus assembly protein TadG